MMNGPAGRYTHSPVRGTTALGRGGSAAAAARQLNQESQPPSTHNEQCGAEQPPNMPFEAGAL
jgi:hypothetical protein